MSDLGSIAYWVRASLRIDGWLVESQVGESWQTRRHRNARLQLTMSIIDTQYGSSGSPALLYVPFATHATTLLLASWS